MSIQPLEERIVLAWDMALVGAGTTQFVSANTAAGTTTFTATGSGAQLDWNDVFNALSIGDNVVIDSGATGTEAGNITDMSGIQLSPLAASNLSLTIESGSGPNLVGDISIQDINFDATNSSLILSAAGSVSTGTLSGGTFLSPLPLASISITAAAGSITAQTSPFAGPIQATNLSLKATTGIGSAATPLPTQTGNLVAQTATGGINISNTGNLTVGFAGAPFKGVQDTGATGDINLTNAGGVTINRGNDIVKGPANVTITATGATADITTGGDNSGVDGSTAGSVQAGTGVLTLNAGRDILVGDTTAHSYGDVSSSGSLALTAGRDITVDQNSFLNVYGAGDLSATAGRNISFLSTGAFTGARTGGGNMTFQTGTGGVFTLNSGSSAVSGIRSTYGAVTGGTITVIADDMLLNDVIQAGSGTVILKQASTTPRNIDLGGGTTAGDLDLSDAELGQITAAALRIGRGDNAGDITFTAPVTAHAGFSNLQLISGGQILDATSPKATDVTIAGTLALTGANGIGTSAAPFTFSAPNVSTDSSANNGDQYIASSSAITLLGSVNAGSGTISLGGGTFKANANVNLAGGLTVSAGTYDANGFSTTVAKTTTISGGTLNTSGQTLASKDLVLSSGTLNATNATINLSGNWTQSGGGFTATGSTVNLTGTGQTINGNTTFNNLTKTVATADTLTFAAGSTTTVTGALTLQGAANNLLSLRSSTPGTRWMINPQDTANVSYVDVQDSDNVDAAAINATHSVTSGNNVNWILPDLTYNAPANSNLTLTLDAGGTNVVLKNGLTTIATQPLAATTSVTINGSTGETLTVDNSNGKVTVPTINFNNSAANANQLVITDNSTHAFNNVTVDYSAVSANNGDVKLDATTINYVNLTPILLTSSVNIAGDLTYNLPSVATDSKAILQDGAGGQIILHSGAGQFEDATFPNPAGALIIMRGNANDTLSVSTANLTSSLTVGAGASPFTTLTIAAPLMLNGNLEVHATSINENAASVSTTGTQTYDGSTFIGTDATLSGSSITFNGTLNTNGTVHNLTVFSPNNTTLGGEVGVGGAFGLLTFDGGAGALSGIGTTTINTDAMKANQLSFNNSVTLAQPAILITSAANTTFAGAVSGTTAGGQALTVSAGAGNVTFGAAVGSLAVPLASLSVNGTGGTTLSGSVTTKGNQNYAEPVTLTAASTTLDSSAGGGNVAFSGTINGTTAGNQALVVSAGTGNVTFGAAVGSPAVPLASLTINGSGGTTLSGNVTTKGNQTYVEPVTLTAASTTLDSSAGGGNVAFSGAVNGTTAGNQALVVSAGTGNVTFGAAVGSPALPLASLTVNGTGSTTLSGNVTTKGNQIYVEPVALTAASTTLDSSAGGGNVAFSGTVNGTTAGNQALVVSAGTGNVGFGAAVGSAAIPLASLTVNGTGSTTLSGNVTTKGNQTYTEAVTLTAASTTLDSSAGGGNVAFAGTVNGTTAGNQALVVTAGAGNITFGGNVGATPLASLTISGGTGTTTIKGNVTTSGAQDYAQSVILAASPIIFTTGLAAGDNVTFEKAIDSDSALTRRSFTVNAGAGNVTFNDAVGTVGDATVMTTGSFVAKSTINAGSIAVSGGGVTPSAAATFLGNVFANDVSDADGVQVAASTITLRGITVKTTAAGAPITLTGGTLLAGGSVSVDASLGNGSITFDGTLDGTQNVTLNAGANGNIVFTGNVGLTTAALNNVTIVNAKDVTVKQKALAAAFTQQAGTGTTTFDDNVTLSGANAGFAMNIATGTVDLQTVVVTASAPAAAVAFNAPVILTGNSQINTSNGNVTFTSTVDSDTAATPRSLNLSVGTGNVGFAAAVGSGQKLASLEVDGAAASVATFGGNVTTTGPQTYKEAVQLATNIVFASTDPILKADILFDSTIDNGTAPPHSLTVKTTGGHEVFNGLIGSSGGLSSLTTGGGQTVLNKGGTLANPSVVTSGAQNYGDNVQLGAPLVVLKSDNAPVAFVGKVDAKDGTGQGLQVQPGTGDVTFSADVGASTPLSSLEVDGSSGTTTLGGNVTTTGTQIYNEAVKISAPLATLSTTNSDVTFAKTIDAATGAEGLKVSVGAGNVGFGAAVGSSRSLASLEIDGLGGSVTTLGGNVTTSGPQTYNEALQLATNVALASTGAANITINGMISNQTATPRALSVTTNGGKEIFNSGVGVGPTGLASLTTGGGETDLNGIGVVTVGDQIYGDAVRLSGGGNLLTTQNSNVTFASTVDAAVADAVLIINTNAGGPGTPFGTVSFNGDVGGSGPLSGLFVTSGPFTLRHAIKTTSHVSITVPHSTAADNINLASGSSINSAQGNVTLTADHNVTVATSSFQAKQGVVNIIGDSNTASGATVNLISNIDATRVNVAAKAGSDTVNLDTTSSPTFLTIAGTLNVSSNADQLGSAPNPSGTLANIRQPISIDGMNSSAAVINLVDTGTTLSGPAPVPGIPLTTAQIAYYELSATQAGRQVNDNPQVIVQNYANMTNGVLHFFGANAIANNFPFYMPSVPTLKSALFTGGATGAHTNNQLTVLSQPGLPAAANIVDMANTITGNNVPDQPVAIDSATGTPQRNPDGSLAAATTPGNLIKIENMAVVYANGAASPQANFNNISYTGSVLVGGYGGNNVLVTNAPSTIFGNSGGTKGNFILNFGPASYTFDGYVPAQDALGNIVRDANGQVNVQEAAGLRTGAAYLNGGGGTVASRNGGNITSYLYEYLAPGSPAPTLADPNPADWLHGISFSLTAPPNGLAQASPFVSKLLPNVVPAWETAAPVVQPVDAAYVHAAYQAVLHRDASANDVSFWVGAGASPETLAFSLIRSPEYLRNQVIEPTYQSYLRRPASDTDAAYWTDLMLHHGLTSEQFEVNVLSSDEYYNHIGGGHADTWVEALYNDVLGHPATAAEVAYWVSQVTAGGSRAGVAYSFVAGPERASAQVVAGYTNLLGRTPSDAELAYWVNLLGNGLNHDVLIADFVTSAEFVAKHS